MLGVPVSISLDIQPPSIGPGQSADDATATVVFENGSDAEDYVVDHSIVAGSLSWSEALENPMTRVHVNTRAASGGGRTTYEFPIVPRGSAIDPNRPAELRVTLKRDQWLGSNPVSDTVYINRAP